MLLCGFSWRSNRNHYLSPRLVMSALVTSKSMYVRVPTEIHKSNALLVLWSLPEYHGEDLTVILLFGLAQNMMPIWKLCLAKYTVSNSPYIKIRGITEEYRSKLQNFARSSHGRRPWNKVGWRRIATALPTELYLITWLRSSVGSAILLHRYMADYQNNHA